MPRTETERALRQARHTAVVHLRSRASLAASAEVAQVADAIELVLIERGLGRTESDVRLLQSELASVAHTLPDDDGRRLFALAAMDDQRWQNAPF